MQSTISKWGNSQGVRIPAGVLKTISWAEDLYKEAKTFVDVTADRDTIIIRRMPEVVEEWTESEQNTAVDSFLDNMIEMKKDNKETLPVDFESQCKLTFRGYE